MTKTISFCVNKTRGFMTHNIIYNSDCISGMLRFLQDNSIDLVLTDPPYGLSKGLIDHDEARETRKEGGFNQLFTGKGVWDCFETEQEFTDFTESWLLSCYQKLKEGGHIFTFGTHHNIFITYNLLHKLNYHFRQLLIWYSPVSPPSQTGKVFQHCCEYILWATKGDNYTFNNTKERMQHLTKQIQDIFIINSLTAGNPERIEGHPTQKPTELLSKIIKIATNEDNLVLDCFLGSGSTMLACQKTNRNCIGFEINQDFIEIIKRKVNFGQLPHTFELITDQKPLDEQLIQQTIDSYSGLIGRNQAIEIICKRGKPNV